MASLQLVDDGLPDPCTFALGQVLGAADLCLRVPVAWLWNPIGLWEKRRLGKDDAPYLVIGALAFSLSSLLSVLLNPSTHVRFGCGPVLRPEGGPGKTRG